MTGKKKPDTHFTPKLVMGNTDMLMPIEDIAGIPAKVVNKVTGNKLPIHFLGSLLCLTVRDLLAEYDLNRPALNSVNKAINDLGYEIGQTSNLWPNKIPTNPDDIRTKYEIADDGVYSASESLKSDSLAIDVRVPIPPEILGRYNTDLIRAALTEQCQRDFATASRTLRLSPRREEDLHSVALMAAKLRQADRNDSDADKKAVQISLCYYWGSAQSNRQLADLVAFQMRQHVAEIVELYADRNPPLL